MKAFLIDGNKLVSDAIEQYLNKEKIECRQARTPFEALDCIASHSDKIDFIIINFPMNEMDLGEFMEKLKENRILTPVLLISNRSALDDRAISMLRPDDDYIVHPFNAKELAHRARKMCRGVSSSNVSLITNIGPIAVDFDRHKTLVHDRKVNLTCKKQQIIEIMASNKGRVISKEMFLNEMYNRLDEPEERVIDVFICKLRKKLERSTGGHEYIQTVWGRGYCMDDM